VGEDGGVRLITRHVALGCLSRGAALAGIAAALGALVGLVEEGNRAALAAAGSPWSAALSRIPEVVFFASPLITVLAVLWSARDLVPASVEEGLGGAGVPGRRIDAGLAVATVFLGAAAALLGGWLAPLAQRSAAPDPAAAWARSGGAPEWAAAGWTWVRTPEGVARVQIDGSRVRVTRALAWGPRGPVELPAPAALPSRVLPSVDDVAVLSLPPAFLTLPELFGASTARERFGHLAAPVYAEISLRAGIVLLLAPASLVGLACRRVRRASRRWSLVAAFVLAAMLGLQASHVWATRGELPVLVVVLVPLLLGSLVAAAAWRLRTSAD
jgi:hypothetical protein